VLLSRATLLLLRCDCFFDELQLPVLPQLLLLQLLLPLAEEENEDAGLILSIKRLRSLVWQSDLHGLVDCSICVSHKQNSTLTFFTCSAEECEKLFESKAQQRIVSTIKCKLHKTLFVFVKTNSNSHIFYGDLLRSEL
jgi:hypothetical protein